MKIEHYKLLMKVISRSCNINLLFIYWNNNDKCWYATDGKILIGIKDEKFEGNTGPYTGIKYGDLIKMIYIDGIDIKFPNVSQLKITDEKLINEIKKTSVIIENDYLNVMVIRYHIQYDHVKVLKSYTKLWWVEYIPNSNNVVLFNNGNVFSYMMPINMSLL